MGFVAAIQSCLRQYVTFSGRACRSEYWYWIVFGALASIALMVVDSAIFGTPLGKTGQLGSLFSLATLLPNISVFVRRLHDTDRSGWWFWLMLVPLIGVIIALIWLCSKGTSGDNRFGADPLA